MDEPIDHAAQQPGESRAEWKNRTFGLHYGAGPSGEDRAMSVRDDIAKVKVDPWMPGEEFADAILALPEMVELRRHAAIGQWVEENPPSMWLRVRRINGQLGRTEDWHAAALAAGDTAVAALDALEQP